jgi:argininosuccinate lyase
MIRKGRFNKPQQKTRSATANPSRSIGGFISIEIAGSMAHARALARAGIITAAECRKIENGLRAIEQEVESGEFKWDRTLEDVHMEH